MPIFTPDTLARWTSGRWLAPPRGTITGFGADTRRLGPGQMFVALKTEKRDGHDFLAAALAAGAAAALVAVAQPGCALPQLVVADPLTAFQAVAREHRQAFPGPVVGVTGSAGKTSTKDLLARLLGANPGAADVSPVLATPGNLNNAIGVPLTLTQLDASVHAYAVVEAGINLVGEMATLAGMIAPDIAIVTLVAPAHLEGLGSLEGVAREKARLAAAVRPSGVAIFPSACTAFAAFRDLAVPTLPVGGPGAPVSFSVEHGEAGTELRLSGPGIPAGPYALPRMTEGMAQNAALALTAAFRLGVPADLIRQRLAQWQPAALRGEWIRQADQLLYLDCYNANPASMSDALATFTRSAPAALPRLFLIGGMEELGPDSARYHTEVGGRLQLRPEDELWLIGGQAAAFRTGALAAGARAAQITLATSLAPLAARLAGFQGAVFIKGSRRYQLETLVPEAVTGPLHA